MTDTTELEGVVTPLVSAMDTLILEDPPIADVPYYFAAETGWFQNVPTLFGVAQIPSQKWPPGLPKLKESFTFSDELVPRFIFDQALDFFRKVYAQHKTEATTYICRAPDGQYSLFIPTQYVTAASVNHKVEAGEMGDRFPVGTIHSHCNFSAFHSGTDEHDMGKMPGLHATIGMVASESPQIATALAIGSTRFTLEVKDIVDESVTQDANGYNTAPDHWLTFVKPNETAPWQAKGITTYYGKKTIGFQGKGEWAGGWRGKWDDDDYGEWKPKVVSATQTQEGQLVLEECENELAGLILDLAEQGYRLQYTITHEPAMAAAYLANLDNGKANKLWED